MATTRFSVAGLADLNRALGELSPATGKAVLRGIAAKRLEPMRAKAEEHAPEQTGDLKGSLKVSSRQKTGGAKRRSFEGKAAVEVHMGPTGEGYPEALPQEFGWLDHPGSPYMRPAWDEEHGNLLDGIAKDLGSEIDKAAKRAARKRARG